MTVTVLSVQPEEILGRYHMPAIEDLRFCHRHRYLIAFRITLST
jgi:hypothetical protein